MKKNFVFIFSYFFKVYIDSEKYGPEDIKTSLNYYLMGKIFNCQNRKTEAESFFGKVKILKLF